MWHTLDDLYTPSLSDNDVANGISISEEVVAAALKNIYNKKYGKKGTDGIDSKLFSATRDIFNRAAAEGIANAVDTGTPAPDEAFLRRIDRNNAVFSAFRTHRMQKDVAALLFDNKGKIKPFHIFQKDVEPVIGKYRKDWLRTEYATAIQRSRIAAQWPQFVNEADVFPNLEWVQSTSAHPGADHQIFWGVIQPVNAPFWDRHRPGDRWNCQCGLRQTDEEPTDIPSAPIGDTSNSPSPGLDNNPGKDGILFNDHHPYFPQSCASCPFAATGKKLFALVGGRKKNCYECILVNDSVLNKQKEDEQKQEYIRKSKEIIDNIYNTIGLHTEIPLPIQNNYCTGKLLINKSVRYMLRTHHHSKSIESKEAFFYMLRNPEILHYESSSYVGETKKEDDPKDKKNIIKKLKRNVTSYNYYYFSYNNKEWIIGYEVIKNEFEQPYFISLRKNKKALRNRNLRGLRPSPTPKRKYYMSTD